MEKTDPPLRKSVTLPASVWDRIAAFRFAQHIGTEAEVIRRLLIAGLRAEEQREARRRKDG